MKKLFNDFTKFEIAITIVGLAITLFTSTLNETSLIVLFNGIVSILCAVYTSKGKIEAQYYTLLSAISYCFIAFDQKYYAEVIFQAIVVVPFSIVGIIKWKKHLDESGTVTIYKGSTKEIVLACIIHALLFVPFYYFFKLFNTDSLVISTIIICINVAGLYFSIKSYYIFYYAFLACDILRVILWIIPLFEGQQAYIPTIVSQAFFFIVDLYGLLEWRKRSTN